MIRQIILVVLIPQAITKWSKRPGKGNREGKVQSTCFAHLWPLPRRDTGCLLALAGQYKTLTRHPFWGLPSVVARTVKPQSRAQLSLRAGHIIHSHKHTRELVKQKMRVLRKQRGYNSECFYLALKILDEPPRWQLTVSSVRFLISEDLALGPGTEFDHSRALV